MKTTCPWCGQNYEVTGEDVGQTMHCEQCGKEFKVAPPTLHRTPIILKAPQQSAPSLHHAPVVLQASQNPAPELRRAPVVLKAKSHPSSVSRIVSIVVLVVLCCAIFSGATYLAVFYYKKVTTERREAKAALEAELLAVAKKQAEERLKAEKERKRLEAEQLAQQKRQEEEKAKEEERKRREELRRTYEPILRKKLNSENEERQRRMAALAQTEKDAILKIEERYARSEEQRVKYREAEIQAIADEEKKTTESLAKILEDKLPLAQLIAEAESLPPFIQADAARIILARCILAKKNYAGTSLQEIAQTDFQNDERVYVVCPLCKGSGQLHCVTCKDTRVCQRCGGSGTQQTRILRNNEIVSTTIPCSRVCQLCAGKSCRVCGGARKVLSKSLKNRIQEMMVEVQTKKKGYYQAQNTAVRAKYAKQASGTKPEMEREIAAVKEKFAASLAKQQLVCRLEVAGNALEKTNDTAPELIYYHGSLSPREWDILLQTPEMMAASDSSRYRSQESAGEQNRKMLEDLKKARDLWKSQIELYQTKQKQNQQPVPIEGSIQEKRDDGWYLFTSNGYAGALKPAENGELPASGQFACLGVSTGKKLFYKNSGETVELPTFTALSISEQAILQMNYCMVISAKNNFEFCTQEIERLSTLNTRVEDALRKMKKATDAGVDLPTDHMKYIVDNDQIVDLILLCQKGLDINKVYQDGAEKITILMYAVQKHRNEIVKFLIRQGVYLDARGVMKCPDLCPVSAVGVAAFYGNETALDLLLKANANVCNGRSPYQLVWNGENGIRPAHAITATWEKLNDAHGNANYICDPADDHFILKMIEDESADMRVLQHLLNVCRVNPWRCRQTKYELPNISDKAWEEIENSDYALK